MTIQERIVSIPFHLITPEIENRFWDKIQIINDADSCWLWTASRYDNRYGQFLLGKTTYRAHRIMYWLAYEIDPGEFFVCHTCNSSLCVRPTHLYLGDASENQRYSYICGRNIQRGELNNGAKLTKESAAKIVELRKTLSVVKIARMYSVSSTTIYNVLSGRSNYL